MGLVTATCRGRIYPSPTRAWNVDLVDCVDLADFADRAWGVGFQMTQKNQ
ncbi:MAG: hypothetical protein FWG87_14345 [Defluviitaleaceae bacterium]|nr:hypothetical protein [Defluviitaleaceae bacterium]